MRQLRWGLLVSLGLSLTLAACGGGSLGDDGTGGEDDTTYRFGYLFQGSFSSGVIGAKSNSLAAGGSTTLQVDVVDDTGARVTGKSVDISFTSDCIAAGTAIVDPASGSVTGGTFQTTYTAAGCVGEDNITATATVDGDTLEAYTTLTVAAASAVYHAGVLSNGSLQEGVLGVGDTELSASAQTELYIDIVDATGARVSGVDATATFSSDCIVSNLATVSSNPATSSNGRISATYTANGCVATDVITGIVVVGENSLTVTGSINVLPPELSSIDFDSADPTVIGISGSSVDGQSTVTFTVKDSTGAGLAGQKVLFSFDGETGGATLNPTSAVSNASGVVSTVVNAGSTHTVVRVLAEATSAVTGTYVSKRSDQLVISTGVPDQNSMSLSADRLSVSGECDGEPVTITIRAGDRYNTAIPDGTAVSFDAEGGKIAAQCFTETETQNGLPDAGVCSALLTVQNPRPVNGRVAVLAAAKGEESFDDPNGNGYYDAGESFGDLPEAYSDENENGVYDSGEYFLDYNGNFVHDDPNGSFTGYECASPGVNCSANTLDVFAQINIVFSTDVARLGRVQVVPGCSDSASDCGYVPLNSTLTWTNPGDTASVTVGVSDSNGNPLPTGTTYALSVSVGSVTLPSSGTLGPYNTNTAGLLDLSYAIKAPSDTTAASGAAILTISIPASSCLGAKTIETQLFKINYVPG